MSGVAVQETDKHESTGNAVVPSLQASAKAREHYTQPAMQKRILACLVGALMCACSDNDSPGASGAAGASGSGGSAGSAGDAGSGGSAGNGGIGTIPRDLKGDGYVYASQGPTEWTLTGAFTAWQASSLCTFANDGPCRIDTCIPATVHVSAGSVGVAAGDTPYTLESSGTGPVRRSGFGRLWAPGQTLRLFIEGDSQSGSVPAVEENVSAPGPFTLTTPVPAATLSVPRSQRLTARWTGGQYGTVVIGLTGKSSTAQDVQVKCSFDSESRTGTIPASAVSRLSEGAPGYLLAFAEGYKLVLKEKWLLRMAARTEAVVIPVTYQ